MKVFIETIGCRFNQIESAEMQGLLEEKGYSIIRSFKDADIYIINSCTVTGKSDSRSRQAVRKAREANGSAFIVLTGCYAQMNRDEASRLDKVDLVLGNDKKLEIVNILKKLIQKGKTKDTDLETDDVEKRQDFPLFRYSDYKIRSRGFLKVQTGCDNKCSYCIVTLARGRSRSATIEYVERQIHALIEKGFQEIVLSGINIGSYGEDLGPKSDLYSLLKRIIGIKGLKRVRLSSLSPLDVTDDIISLIRDSGKICRHLHISLQSGDSYILKRMRRNYTAKDAEAVLSRVASHISGVCLGADIIVGFPEETEERYKNTLSLLSDMPVNYLHLFRFSPRPGTEAARMNQTVDEITKKARSSKLKALSAKKFLDFKKKQLGTYGKIVVESKAEQNTGILKGLTDNYIPVLIDEDKNLINKLVHVHLTRLIDGNIYGRVSDK